MDNLRCHKVADGREAIKAVGASLMFIPPYSPGLWSAPRPKPIEQAFDKLNALLRARELQTAEALGRRWEHCLTALSQQNVSTTSAIQVISSQPENAPVRPILL